MRTGKLSDSCLAVPFVLGPIFFLPALGSWWGLLLVLPIVGVLIARILNEEKVLAESLDGYREYLARVRYRLIPGLW